MIIVPPASAPVASDRLQLIQIDLVEVPMRRFIPSWFLRIVVVLLLSLTALVGVTTLIGVRSLPTEAACLRYTINVRDHGQIDLRNGAQISTESGAITDGDFGTTADWTWLSPNSKRMALLHTPEDAKDQAQLMLKSADAPSREAVKSDQPFLANTFDRNNFAWSSDSRWFAYAGTTLDDHWFLSIVSADGSEKWTIALQASNEDVISLYGWSTDDSYLALGVDPDYGVAPNQTGSLTLYSAPDLKLLRSVTFPKMIRGRAPQQKEDLHHNRDLMQWSPRGDWFAFLDVSGSPVMLTLHLLSPNANSDLSFPVLSEFRTSPDLRSRFALFWSSDGLHLALLSIPDPNTHPLFVEWRLDVFGVDGTAFRQVTRAVSSEMPLAFETLGRPAVYWSADSQTLLYANAHAIDGSSDYWANRADLMAWHVGSGQPAKLVQANIDPNPDLAVDKRYLFYEIEQNGKVNLFALDTSALAQRFVIEDKSGNGTSQIRIQSPERDQYILSAGNSPIATLNLTTGEEANLSSQYWDSWRVMGEPMPSDDWRTVGALSVDQRTFRFTAVADGIQRIMNIVMPAPGELFSHMLSPDGTLIVLAYQAGHMASAQSLVIYNRDGIRLHTYTDLKMDAGSLHFAPCS